MLVRILNNWSLKLTALVLSLALWSHVRGQVNPWETATFKARLQAEVPRGYTVSNSGELPKNVVVTLRGPRLTLRALKGPAPANPLATGEDAPLLPASQLNATLDFSGAKKGAQSVVVKVSANIEDVEVVGSKPNEIEVTLDAAEMRRFMVRPQLPATSNLKIDEVKLSQERAVVSGPSKSLDRIVRVRARVSRGELKAGTVKLSRVPLEAVDSNGDVLADVPVEPAFVGMEVQASERQIEKSVAVKVETTGAPADGYAVETVNVVPPRMTIRGPRRILDKIGTLPVKVNLNGTRSNLIREEQVQVLENVQFLGARGVRVRITLKRNPTPAPTPAKPAATSTPAVPEPASTPALPQPVQVP